MLSSACALPHAQETRPTTKPSTLSVSVWGSQVSVKLIFLHMRVYNAWNSTMFIEAPQRFSKNVSSNTKLKCNCYIVLVKFPRFHSFSRVFASWHGFILPSDGCPAQKVVLLNAWPVNPWNPGFYHEHPHPDRYILPTRLTGENRPTSFPQEVVRGTCTRNWRIYVCCPLFPTHSLEIFISSSIPQACFTQLTL